MQLTQILTLGVALLGFAMAAPAPVADPNPAPVAEPEAAPVANPTYNHWKKKNHYKQTGYWKWHNGRWYQVQWKKHYKE
ncbi:hypothetical protein TWF730_008628 [Orbilia blumenaviensis]|uniref:Uncharacterized protein n=1 Tax=Orbilia blumenaviensis TaxID=1796055 RepID=A0AAV9V312_9PEZI